MEPYIKKADIVAEIKRRISVLKANESVISMLAGGMFVNEFKDLLSFLDTLEVKDVDLVEEFADFLEKENAYVDDNNVISYYNGSSFNHTCDIYPIAKHFFELGLKAREEA